MLLLKKLFHVHSYWLNRSEFTVGYKLLPVFKFLFFPTRISKNKGNNNTKWKNEWKEREQIKAERKNKKNLKNKNNGNILSRIKEPFRNVCYKAINMFIHTYIHRNLLILLISTYTQRKLSIFAVIFSFGKIETSIKFITLHVLHSFLLCHTSTCVFFSVCMCVFIFVFA